MTRKKIAKSFGRKIRYISYAKKNAAAPRWLDLKVYGKDRAYTRSVKRFKSRTWRRSSAKI